MTLDNHVTLDYDHADEVIPHHYAFAVSGAEFDGNRGTYFRDPDGHLMEILTAAGEPS